MTTAPTKTVTTTTITPGKKVSVSRTTSGGSTTITRTTTIGTPKKVSSGSSGSSTTSPTKAAGTLVESGWITGPNDSGWTLCGPVAIANALLSATGVRATNADIERLYRAGGGLGDSGAPLAAFLAAAASSGLSGECLASYSPVGLLSGADLVLMAVAGLPDLHTAAVSDGHAVMWGAAVPLADINATVLDAWSLTWHGEGTK